MKNFRRFAFAATVITFFVIFAGGLVRVSGAGLGCPDWPTCFGRWFPPTDISQLPPDIDPAQFNFALAWIEYVNRLTGVILGALIAIAAIWALAKFRKYPRIVVPSVLAAVMVAYQGWQGGQMIAADLAPYLVSIHMGVAFIIAALMLYVTQQAYYIEKDAKPASTPLARQFNPWLIGLITISIIQVFLGTQMRTALEHVAETFPLLPKADWLGQVGSISTIHTVLGIIVTLVTWQVGALILKRVNRPAPEIVQTTWALIILVTLQVIIGGILIFAGVPDILELFHLLVSALSVGVLILLIPALRYETTAASVPTVMPRLKWVLPVLAFMIFIGVSVNYAADTSRGELPALGNIPEFQMTDQNGQAFGRDDMLGHITIVDFFFTSCPGVCPVLNGNMAELYRKLKGSDQVHFMSVSVDPDRDSLAALRAYAEKMGVDDNRWVFLRAPLPEVVQLCEKGFMMPAENLPMGHTTRFTLVDPQGRIRGYYDGMDQTSIKVLLGHLRLLGGESP